MMIQIREMSWWYWLASAMLLLVWGIGSLAGLWLALGLALVQVGHFRLREGSFRAFPVQVRIAYAAILALGAWEPIRPWLWAPTIGTTAQVLFGYCALARLLSLLPWNRQAPLSASLVWRTFTAPPRQGSVLQGLPATTA
jgi:hypothetical protein